MRDTIEQRKDWWDKSKILGGISIPIAILIVGTWFNLTLEHQRRREDRLSLATTILETDPVLQVPEYRKMAIDFLDEAIDDEITDETRRKMMKSSLTGPYHVPLALFQLANSNDATRLEKRQARIAFSSLVEMLIVDGNSKELDKVLLETIGYVGEPVDVGSSHVLTAAAEGRLDSLRVLLKRGYGVEARTTTGANPVFEAVRGGHKDVLEFLLEDAHADISIVNFRNGFSPLTFAFEKKNFAIANWLLDHPRISETFKIDVEGLDVWKEQLSGTVPTDAYQSDELKRQRKAYNELEALMEQRKDLKIYEYPTKAGRSPLSLACIHGNETLVRKLLGMVDLKNEKSVDYDSKETGNVHDEITRRIEDLEGANKLSEPENERLSNYRKVVEVLEEFGVHRSLPRVKDDNSGKNITSSD